MQGFLYAEITCGSKPPPYDKNSNRRTAFDFLCRAGPWSRRRESPDFRTRPQAALPDFPRRDTRPRVSGGIPGGMPLRHGPALPQKPKTAQNLRIPGFTFPRGEGGPRSGG